jgi:hypothetical protein
MRRYRRDSMSGRTRKLLIGGVALAIAGGAFAISTGVSSAGENCVGLDQALRQNLQFIAGQRADPDALSDARIANRQAVVDLINQRRAVAGCTANVAAAVPGAAAGPAKPPKTTAPAAPATTAPATGNDAGRNNAGGNNASGNNAGGNNAGTGAGQVVCKGSTVTLSGEGGAPFASSGTFPIGTVLKVTNLDNNKSITVKVQTPSGSCVLLNNAAFEQVREAGKFLIRHAVIEQVG